MKKLLMMPENTLYGNTEPYNVKGFRFTNIDLVNCFAADWHAKNFTISGFFSKEKAPTKMWINFWYNYEKYIIPAEDFKTLLGICKNPELINFI